MKVLILSTGTGEGHNSAAKAVKEQFERRNIPCELADVLDFASDKASAYGRRIYIWSTVRAKKVFAGAYRAGRAISSARLKSPVYFANALYADRLCSYIKENGYDTVVMPHLFPAEAMTWLLRKHKLDVQTYFIATDYTCIPFTEETRVDYYFIPHEELATEFIKRGIPAEKLVPTGIPVSERFLHLPTRAEARAHLGIPTDKPCILMMTGSMGYGRVESMAEKLVEQTNGDTQLYIMGGTNEELKKTLRDTYAGMERVQVLDFTTEAHLYMAAADVLFTKPGGLTSTEAVAAKVALVHTKPIPGCEDRNVAFFTEHGMSVSGDREESMIQKGLELLRNPAAQARMRECQEKYGKPYAADAVCEFICGRKETMEAAREEA